MVEFQTEGANKSWLRPQLGTTASILWMKLAQKTPPAPKIRLPLFLCFSLMARSLFCIIKGKNAKTEGSELASTAFLFSSWSRVYLSKIKGLKPLWIPGTVPTRPSNNHLISEEYRIPHFSIIHVWWVNSRNRSERWISKTLLQECQVGYSSGVWGVGGPFLIQCFFLFKMLDAD